MTNPWIEPAVCAPKRREPVRAVPVWQPGADVSVNAALPMSYGGSSGVYVVGAHGGAGVSTLAGVLGVRDAGTSWPVTLPPSCVIVVARTHRHGLVCAQRAAIQWASGAVDAQLVGLVLVADGPKAVKSLQGFERVVRGAFPRVWDVEWVESWRAERVERARLPSRLARTCRDITRVIERTLS